MCALHKSEERVIDILEDLVYGNEILVYEGNKMTKLDTNKLIKALLEKRSLNLRLKEVLSEEVRRDEKLPSLWEILYDAHYLQYGKHAYEVKGTGIICPICGMEIDEYGYCGCGCGSD